MGEFVLINTFFSKFLVFEQTLVIDDQANLPVSFQTDLYPAPGLPQVTKNTCYFDWQVVLDLGKIEPVPQNSAFKKQVSV